MAAISYLKGMNGKILIKAENQWIDNVHYRIPETKLAEHEDLPQKEELGQIEFLKNDYFISSLIMASKATLYLDDGIESWDFKVVVGPNYEGKLVVFKIRRVLKDES